MDPDYTHVTAMHARILALTLATFSLISGVLLLACWFFSRTASLLAEVAFVRGLFVLGIASLLPILIFLPLFVDLRTALRRHIDAEKGT